MDYRISAAAEYSRWVVVVVLLFGVGFGSLACAPPIYIDVSCASCGGAGSDSESAAELILEDENVSAWMTINNTFAGGDPEYPTEGTRAYWSGILFQLGVFEPATLGIQPPGIFKSVELWSGEHREAEYEADAFSWINVVASTDEWGAPLDPDDALMLYPSAEPDGCHCESVTCSPHDAPLADECLRNRMLHAQLRSPINRTNPYDTMTQNILTYWSGVSGHSMTATRDHGHDEAYSRFEFHLPDPIAVAIFIEHHEVIDGDLVVTMESVRAPFGVGVIDRVVITYDPPSTTHGLRHDPAWPTES